MHAQIPNRAAMEMRWTWLLLRQGGLHQFHRRLRVGYLDDQFVVPFVFQFNHDRMMIPCEHSSGPRQRLGQLSKQGNALLRYLWCEAAMHAVNKDADLKRFYRRKLVQKGMGKARVAAARKLGIRLWIMLRDEIDYEEFCRP